MSPERWARVKEVFAQAVARPTEERTAFLAQACAGDPELRFDAESLLDAHVEDSFLEGPAHATLTAPDSDAPPAPPPSRVGPYRVLGEIARGGMGIVCRALRDDDAFKKQVAVKLIKRGMDTDAVVGRFRQERQILADLDHPGIARLLDGGSTEDGRPFLVMEYVEGVPLTEHCDRQALSVRDRLLLFREVCAAVQHAHQKLVVHRDLKPSNIMVTSEGRPKLLDFGISKLLGPDPGGETGVMTQAGLRLLTPHYASPEQVRGERVSMASDVYSLGVILYEILTGRPPYVVTGADMGEVHRKVCETDPVRPSTVVTQAARLEGQVSPEVLSRRRGTTPARLRWRLAGDLDAIVLKALEKDPRDRYASVEQLTADLDRHLQGRPVRAQPQTALYRASKFVRRNKAALGTGTAVALALLAATATAVRQAHIASRERQAAEKNFSLARQAVDRYFVKVSQTKLLEVPRLQPLRRDLLDTARLFYEELVKERRQDVTLRRELADTLARLSEITAALGSRQDAVAHLERAVALLQDERRRDPRAVLEPLARALGDLGALHQGLADHTRAAAGYNASVELWQTLASAQPQETEWRRQVALGKRGLASILMAQGQLEAAANAYGDAFRLHEQVAAQRPQDPTLRDDLAQAHRTLAATLRRTGRLDTAETHLRAALDIWEAMDRTQPAASFLRPTIYDELGEVFRLQGRPADAEQVWTKALLTFRDMAEEYPDFVEVQTSLMSIENNLGRMYYYGGRLGAAEAIYRQAIPRAERVAALQPGDPYRRFNVAAAHINSAKVARDQRRFGEAEAGFRSALAALESLVQAHPDVLMFRLGVGRAQESLGRTDLERGQPAAALRWYDQALGSLSPVLQKNPTHVDALRYRRDIQAGRAEALGVLDRGAEAEAAWAEAVALDGAENAFRVRLARAANWARRGRHVDATREAARVAGQAAPSGETAFLLGQVYALAAASAGSEESGLAPAYLDRCRQQLRRARDLGFFAREDGRRRLRAEPAFTSAFGTDLWWQGLLGTGAARP
jgi:serine/threonine protein kinase/tetratricopeptide (TPR) repeat protein